MPDSSKESKSAGAVMRLTPCSWLLAFGIMAALTIIPTSSAETASEYQIKAAYLYNFAKATQWPEEVLANPDSSLLVGVFGGHEDFVKVVQNTLAGKSINGHPIEIRHSRSVAELKSCQLVFFRASEKDTASIIAALSG